MSAIISAAGCGAGVVDGGLVDVLVELLVHTVATPLEHLQQVRIIDVPTQYEKGAGARVIKEKIRSRPPCRIECTVSVHQAVVIECVRAACMLTI